MNIGLVSVDSKIPNLALMKLSAYHKSIGDSVEIATPLFGEYDIVYRAKVFTYTPDDEYEYTGAEVIDGGTGYDITTTLPDRVESMMPDYGAFSCDHAIGFTTRGCIRKCRFCVVPSKEGSIRAVADLSDFVRPEHKWAMLLDNNITALPEHLERIAAQAKKMNVALDITQAMDARLVDEDIARIIAGIRHKASVRFSMDDPNQDAKVIAGIERVVAAGIRPSRIMVFVLVGAPWLDFDESVQRIEMLRRMGYRPFAMPYRSLDGEYQAHESIPAVRHLARWCNRQELVNVPWKDYAAQINRAALLMGNEVFA